MRHLVSRTGDRPSWPPDPARWPARSQLELSSDEIDLPLARDRHGHEHRDAAVVLIDSMYHSPLLIWWGHEPPAEEVERGALTPTLTLIPTLT